MPHAPMSGSTVPVALATLALTTALAAAPLLAPPSRAAALSTTAASIASDPEVQAQIDLFSAWMEGQIEIRGLPGTVVGVVAGDDLVWARGFGHADIEADRPMETDTRFRMPRTASSSRPRPSCSSARRASSGWTIRSPTTCRGSTSRRHRPTIRR